MILSLEITKNFRRDFLSFFCFVFFFFTRVVDDFEERRGKGREFKG